MHDDDQKTSRRRMLGMMGAAALAAPLVGAGEAVAQDEKKPKEGAAAGVQFKPRAYTLPDLPYKKNALDGYLSAEILELHHDKHHAGYVKGLNNALAGLEEARNKGDFTHVKALERALAFHGSGHVLHTLYWNSMSPDGGGQPKGELAQAIQAGFGSFDKMRGQLAAATKAGEASAWGVLAWEPLGNRLVVMAVEDHQNMTVQGAVPLLVNDVWDQAYYLRYKNDRGSYVDGFFDVANWDYAAQRLTEARKAKLFT